MKKRILSIVAASALAVTMAAPTYASANLKDLMDTAIAAGAFTTTVANDGYGYNATTKHINVQVGSSVVVKQSTSGSWGEHDTAAEALTVKASSVTASNAKFNFKANVDMTNVRKAFKDYYEKARAASNATGLQAEFESMVVDGQFKIVIDTDGLNVPDSFVAGTNLDNFSTATKASGLYSETTARAKDGNKITVLVKAYGDADEIYADLDNKLCDLALECDDVTVKKLGETAYAAGSFGVQVEFDKALIDDAYLDGYTAIKYTQGADIATLMNIDYAADYDKAYVRVNKTTSGGSGGGTGSSLPVTSTNTLNFVTPHGSVSSQTSTSTFTVEGDKLPVPSADDTDMTFDGWYYDTALTQPVQPEDEIVVSGTKTLYAKWLNTKAPDALHNDSDDDTHYAYIIGYPEGDVRPTNNITRAEVVTIFYRLLNDDKRAALRTTTNSFSDVNEGDWFNTYVSTMANGGYIKGYEDGSFKPDQYITRAEFATMAVAFADKLVAPTANFSDIQGHWAAEYILKGAALAWIQGYEDGTFRPDNYILRSEAMTMYNRVLIRHVKGDGFLPNSAILWPDNASDAWYYYEVEEATNSHTYDRQADKYYESWTAVIPNKTWD